MELLHRSGSGAALALLLGAGGIQQELLQCREPMLLRQVSSAGGL